MEGVAMINIYALIFALKGIYLHLRHPSYPGLLSCALHGPYHYFVIGLMSLEIDSKWYLCLNFHLLSFPFPYH